MKKDSVSCRSFSDRIIKELLRTEVLLKEDVSKMRAYIHAFHGRPWNTECQTVYEGFQKLGIETVLFSTNEEFDTRHPEDVVVGGTVIVWHALTKEV